ncbi:hypothetical protein BREVNS_1524 [Brevinematales bacterium NS]|jgi:YbgC/YbaW family acyl-CoA thioester hydrolase|nr:acyl-CoA thioesterase [Brevinematales bacterium]QJR22274.1 hypothetical protein BREVNS_1524 [Brevinematales bacterium NS]
MSIDGLKWTTVEIMPRFYEIDSYGIVNNMFYVGWLEIGRFKIAEEAGLIEQKVLDEKIAFVVSSIEIRYKKPVSFLDTVLLENLLSWEGTGKLVFYHKGKNKRTKEEVVLAKTVVICMKEGKVAVNLPSFIAEKVSFFINSVQGGMLKCPEKFFG